MSLHHHYHHTASPPQMRTYSRKLGANELSYFLPSRAYGMNDMFTRVVFRAPPALVSPFRLRVVWAIMRIQHSLLASRIEMAPGRYDEARFIYTPPPSPQAALEEAARAVVIHDDKTGPNLDEDFIYGARELSAGCLSRVHVARHGQVSPGIEEFHMALTVLHTITDGRSAHGDTILKYLGGSETPGGRVRTDGELFRILEMEWSKRWGGHATAFEVITPPAEARLPRPRSRFQAAAWRIDSINAQRRAIGGHSFPRIPSRATKQALVEVTFDPAQTAALVARCKSERVTLQNAVFALCNLAWLRTAAAHPELRGHAPRTLPTLFYTAIGLRRHLAPLSSPLASPMALALAYGSIVLPGFVPSAADPEKVFWLRARDVQRQMRRQTQSPLLLARAQTTGAERARRAKACAAMDDAAAAAADRAGPAGCSPQSLPAPGGSASAGPPSVALMGISHLGDLSAPFQTECYPSIAFVDSVGHARKAKGGILLFTRSAQRCFSMMLEWDAAAFPPGLVEEFWGHFVAGAHEYILSDRRTQTLSKL